MADVSKIVVSTLGVIGTTAAGVAADHFLGLRLVDRIQGKLAEWQVPSIADVFASTDTATEDASATETVVEEV